MNVVSRYFILFAAFGDPTTHLNFRLGIMKATQPLSDKAIETDPNKAATWFLEFENAIESILRLGDRTTSLGMQCFNAATIYQICERLQYTLQYQTYGLEEDGREKLKKIIDMVTKKRATVWWSRSYNTKCNKIQPFWKHLYFSHNCGIQISVILSQLFKKAKNLYSERRRAAYQVCTPYCIIHKIMRIHKTKPRTDLQYSMRVISSSQGYSHCVILFVYSIVSVWIITNIKRVRFKKSSGYFSKIYAININETFPF